jgi:hypothetical protein
MVLWQLVVLVGVALAVSGAVRFLFGVCRAGRGFSCDRCLHWSMIHNVEVCRRTMNTAPLGRSCIHWRSRGAYDDY